MSEPAIVFERVTFTWPGAAQSALEDITLRVEEGQYLGLIGPNGAGKTTLIRLMMGQVAGYTGRISVCGRDPEAAARNGCVGYVPQRSEANLAFPLSCRDVIAMGGSARQSGWSRASSEQRVWVDRCVDLVGASDFAGSPIGAVSGGQRQRVLIGRALACRPRILVFDEPTSGIDTVGQRRFGELIATLHDELNLAIVLVSHDVRAIVRGAVGCERVACLRRRLHFHEAPGGLTPQVLGEVFQHDLSDVFGEVHVDAHHVGECEHHHGRASDSGDDS